MSQITDLFTAKRNWIVLVHIYATENTMASVRIEK